MSPTDHVPFLRTEPDTLRLTLAAAEDSHAVEPALIRLYRDGEGLRCDLDRLAIQIERLLRERQQIVETLSAFYRSDISISSLRPVLDLCVLLDPRLTTESRR